ncbi:MAG: hypothetical protein IPK82_16990 [Polyangiaceae bacterium]|nr:hypothetical protein [Polyangiaceae bacterium]
MSLSPVDPRPPAQRGVRRVRAALSPERATVGLLVGRLDVSAHHVVFVKGVVEASDGLAALFAERGGQLWIASPLDRENELRELLCDLASELQGTLTLPAVPGTASSERLGSSRHEAPRSKGAHHDSRAPK